MSGCVCEARAETVGRCNAPGCLIANEHAALGHGWYSLPVSTSTPETGTKTRHVLEVDKTVKCYLGLWSRVSKQPRNDGSMY